jgi:hypothetical protein
VKEISKSLVWNVQQPQKRQETKKVDRT